MPILETERIILRPFKISDSQSLYNYRSDAETNKYQNWVPKQLTEAETFISKLEQEFNTPDSWFQLAIVEKISNVLIGDIGLHFIGPDNRQVEIGFTLDKSYQGKRYATESVSKVIEHLFSDLNKHRIFASIDPANTKSRQLLERLGFRKEAHFKKSYYFKGAWVDDVIYALLQSEWRNQH